MLLSASEYLVKVERSYSLKALFTSQVLTRPLVDVAYEWGRHVFRRRVVALAVVAASGCVAVIAVGAAGCSSEVDAIQRQSLRHPRRTRSTGSIRQQPPRRSARVQTSSLPPPTDEPARGNAAEPARVGRRAGAWPRTSPAQSSDRAHGHAASRGQLGRAQAAHRALDLGRRHRRSPSRRATPSTRHRAPLRRAGVRHRAGQQPLAARQRDLSRPAAGHPALQAAAPGQRRGSARRHCARALAPTAGVAQRRPAERIPACTSSRRARR